MTPTNAVPVRIAERDFPSQSAAARHYGVSQAAVWAAIEAGDPDRIARRHACPHCGRPIREETP